MERHPQTSEMEIDLLFLFRVLYRRKWTIIGVILVITLATAAISLTMQNIYESSITIMPNTDRDAGTVTTLGAGFGGLAQLAGIKIPGSKTSGEILAVLKSTILKVEIIQSHNLLPVLFMERWDAKKGQWKEKPWSLRGAITGLFSSGSKTEGSSSTEDELEPTIDEAIRAFEGIMKVKEDDELGTISVEIQHPVPEEASNIAWAAGQVLRESMRRKYIDDATEKKKGLETALIATSDPIIRGKLYELLASQVEAIATAKVNSDFAFKIIDPPRVPDRKVKPQRTLITAIALIGATFLAILSVLVWELINSVRSQAAKSEDASE